MIPGGCKPCGMMRSLLPRKLAAPLEELERRRLAKKAAKRREKLAARERA